MNIISLNFILFCIATVVAFYIMPRKWRWVILLGASFVFYFAVGKKALITMLCVAVFTYLVGRLMEKAGTANKKRLLILAIAVTMIAGWLMVIKIKDAAGVDIRFLITPLGISYVSFSLISYLVDIYWEKEKAETNLGKFLLYVFYFPKISQGPISRYADLKSTLYTPMTVSYNDMCFGMQRMLYGFFKKLVVADRIAIFTGAVFGDISSCSGSVIIVASVLASFQLYCDFSGYMDIALGFSEMLGVRMDENFKRPFFSKSAAEFWRRWHITLGSWFKNYIYTPVVMSKPVKKMGKACRKKGWKKLGNGLMKTVALASVWVLTGLWHGTGANYIVWGLYWGAIIIFSAVFEDAIQGLTKILRINTEAPSWKLFQMLRTFAIFTGGILLTNLGTLAEFKGAIYQMIYRLGPSALVSGELAVKGLTHDHWVVILWSIILIMVLDILEEKRGDVRQQIAELNAPVRWVIYALGITVVLLLGIYGVNYSSSGFAYEHF